MKIPRAVFRYVEHELYNYESSKRQLEELREDIMAKAQRPAELVKVGAEVNNNAISDKTSATAIELVTNSVLVRIGRRVFEISGALEDLAPHHRELFKLKYCENKHRVEICDEMHIEQATYYRYRRELVAMVAIRMAL